ncbi:hypothetical protein DsansV1_C19g0157381 [Dioscorea sansibarensis]
MFLVLGTQQSSTASCRAIPDSASELEPISSLVNPSESPVSSGAVVEHR